MLAEKGFLGYSREGVTPLTRLTGVNRLCVYDLARLPRSTRSFLKRWNAVTLTSYAPGTCGRRAGPPAGSRGQLT